MPNVGVVSVDKLEDVASAAQCQTRCDTLLDFMCRAFEFQPATIVEGVERRARCLLSGDNTITLDSSGTTLPARINSVYRERQCVTGMFDNHFLLLLTKYSQISVSMFQNDA